jgi:hypothetical protein
MTGQPGPGHGKKLGHRGVDASGETTYKKVPFLHLASWMGRVGLPGIFRPGCTPPTHTWDPLGQELALSMWARGGCSGEGTSDCGCASAPEPLVPPPESQQLQLTHHGLTQQAGHSET